MATFEHGQADDGRRRSGDLTARERQIIGLLAEGMTGAQIAAELYLSPETVRTHIRNAMARLGAATRSQAVAIALEQQEIAPVASPGEQRDPPPGPDPPAVKRAADVGPALAEMLAGLDGLYDLDGGAVFEIEDDGMLLQRVAERRAEAAAFLELPQSVALGEGPLGKVALERRSQLLGRAGPDGQGGGVLAAPITGGGRLLGVLVLAIRTSRPTGRGELLLLQAFANRVGEILLSGHDVTRRLGTATERFRASWVVGDAVRLTRARPAARALLSSRPTPRTPLAWTPRARRRSVPRRRRRRARASGASARPAGPPGASSGAERQADGRDRRAARSPSCRGSSPRTDRG